ncbi:32351_t:CDS:10 [Gigaspora margarita]|uniref:32351_t:CDS:1 n=1 Tax=Gigaspora margarita TaxID=4874 RepID=A0ABN7VBI6_GIGMA|nr:32351_t:CDS:10 [Gigaspora margarita]
MLYLLVQVNEGVKCVIPERIMSIESTNQFFDLFDAITLGRYDGREVKVFIRQEKFEGWQEVDNGLDGDLAMLDVLGFRQVKFCLAPSINLDTPDLAQDGPDAFDILMTNSHHKKNPLSQQKLAQLASSLELSISQPWAIMPAVLSLIEILKNYSDYLIATAVSMNEIHYSDKSSRSPENDSIMYCISACKINKLKSDYIELDDFLFEKPFYEHVNIQEFLPNDTIKRYRFIKDLQVSFPIGNYLGTINYVWRIPESEALIDTRMLARIHEELPHYFTRQMHKNVLNKYSYIQKVTPAILRMLHYNLTGNAAVSSDIVSRDVEERLRLMLTLADPNIIVDLRTNNGFKGLKFNAFWDETNAYFNEQNLLAVNERLKTIHGNPLPFDVNIPSDEWIRLQFCPTNTTTTRAACYTGRFNVKFKVQGRLFRKDKFCIQYRQWTCLISADDKHKIPIEEDVAVSMGIRNRRSIVAQESTLVAADHDFSKLSLTSSVIFLISIPNEISGSFYDGHVFVSYQDTIFEPSSAIRHSTEFLNALNIQYANKVMSPILCLYTDGGLDHRCNYGSVQIALISLFLYGDFDLLVAVHTAPNHSWTNPAERIMSTLNLGLQGIALKRDSMSFEFETLFGMVNTLGKIRKKAQESNKLKSELKESIRSVQRMLNNSALKIEETTQAQIRSHLALVEFIDTHCQTRAYSFQAYPILSKGNLFALRLDSNNCILINLKLDNTDHYAAFKDVYGTKTTEEYRPTYIQAQTKSEPIPKSILIAEKIRDYVNCESCQKRRCIYSNKSLTDNELCDFQQALDSYSYSYGAPIFSDNHHLKEVIFVRTQISCDSPIEILYYSSRKEGNYPICYYCGNRDNLVSPPESLKENFKQIYPLCEICQKDEMNFYTRGAIKTNNRAEQEALIEEEPECSQRTQLISTIRQLPKEELPSANSLISIMQYLKDLKKNNKKLSQKNQELLKQTQSLGAKAQHSSEIRLLVQRSHQITNKEFHKKVKTIFNPNKNCYSSNTIWLATNVLQVGQMSLRSTVEYMRLVYEFLVEELPRDWLSTSTL